MRLRPFIFLVAALAPLAACNTREYSKADFYAVLPQLVRYADADARDSASGRRPEGPLYVDVNSFAGGGWQLTGENYNRDTVMLNVGNPSAVRVNKPQEALVIQDTGTVEATAEAAAGLSGGRWVRGYGVMLHLNLVKADNHEIAATVTSYATDRREWPTDICRRVLRVTFRKDAQGAWARTRTDRRKGCDDPDD
jgi:hypothetical protein